MSETKQASSKFDCFPSLLT